MKKGQLIAEIRKINMSVQEAFLMQFEEQELEMYLAVLRADHAKRISTSAFPDCDERPVRLAS